MPTAQLTLTLDASGKLQAEAPGKNGARHKIELNIGANNFDTLRSSIFEIIEELDSQQRDINEAKSIALENARKVAQARYKSIVEYTAAVYPSALKHVLREGDTYHAARKSAFFSRPTGVKTTIEI